VSDGQKPSDFSVVVKTVSAAVLWGPDALECPFSAACWSRRWDRGFMEMRGGDVQLFEESH